MGGIRELTAIFQDVVQKSLQGVKAIASELDKAPSTLYEELLPTVNRPGQGKLGVEDALTIMELTGDIRPLEHMAARLGYVVCDLSAARPDKATLAEELLDDLPPLADFHNAIRAGKPLEEVHALLQKLIRDCEEDFVAYRRERVRQASAFICPGRMSA